MKLRIPALKGQIGKWVYYSCLVNFADVAEHIGFAEDLYKSKALKELRQRSLQGKRTTEIADYIQKEQQRFLGSLIVACHGGDVSFAPLQISDFVGNALPDSEVATGLLSLAGDVKLWALDGQHRLAGIKEAIKMRPELRDEQIPVLIVGHHASQDGLVRTRRLFATLNRNAVRVKITERIALDEDDACAILTRELCENHALFKGDQVAEPTTSQLSPSDKVPFTTLTAIYNATRIILTGLNVALVKWDTESLTKDRRPSDERLRALFETITLFWDAVQANSVACRKYVASRKPSAVPFRRVDGGDLLFRPVGLEAFAIACRLALEDELNKGSILENAIPAAVKTICQARMPNFESPLLDEVLWDANKGGIIAKGKNLAGELVYYYLTKNDLPPKVIERYSKQSGNDLPPDYPWGAE